MKFDYSSIYTTTMFSVSNNLNKLNEKCLEITFQLPTNFKKVYGLIAQAREICKEIMTEYSSNTLSPLEKKMLDARIPSGYGKSVSDYVRQVMRQLKEAREELMQERFECTVVALEQTVLKLQKAKTADSKETTKSSELVGSVRKDTE